MKDWTNSRIKEYGSAFTHRRNVGILYQIYTKCGLSFDKYLKMGITEARKNAPKDPLFNKDFK